MQKTEILEAELFLIIGDFHIIFNGCSRRRKSRPAGQPNVSVGACPPLNVNVLQREASPPANVRLTCR